MAPLIHWFRRDLRLADNTALAAAAHASGGAVIPAFILDDRLLGGRSASPARTRFLLESLQALDAALRERGSALLFRRGAPLPTLLALLRETGAAGVYWNRDYSPYAIARDAAVSEGLRAAGYRAESFKDLVAWEPGELLTAEGRPYTVYTPYARRWRQRLAESGARAAPAPELARVEYAAPAQPIPDLAALGMATSQQAVAAGEAAGLALLRRFTDLSRSDGIAGYHEQRNLPALEGTSRLSPHLRLGTVSVRQCLREIADCRLQIADYDDQSTVNSLQSASDTWVGELIWREFYVQILAHFPHVLRGAFRRALDGVPWENDEALFAAWRAGRTGYPIVDAAMRQLNGEAWMHNRCRMIVASFLTKDLLIDWRWGERYFMQQLVDGDPAANNGGWQWAAGTGTDAQPYFRIFNPTRQGREFDPAGAYVRRYLPELAAVPASFIHEPWKMSPALQRQCGVRIGDDYPAPVVDHAVQRGRALEMYRSVKE